MLRRVRIVSAWPWTSIVPRASANAQVVSTRISRLISGNGQSDGNKKTVWHENNEEEAGAGCGRWWTWTRTERARDEQSIHESSFRRRSEHRNTRFARRVFPSVCRTQTVMMRSDVMRAKKAACGKTVRKLVSWLERSKNTRNMGIAPTQTS